MVVTKLFFIGHLPLSKAIIQSIKLRLCHEPNVPIFSPHMDIDIDFVHIAKLIAAMEVPIIIGWWIALKAIVDKYMSTHIIKCQQLNAIITVFSISLHSTHRFQNAEIWKSDDCKN